APAAWRSSSRSCAPRRHCHSELPELNESIVTLIFFDASYSPKRDGCHRTFYAVLASNCTKNRSTAMKKSPTRESPPQPSEQPRHRNAYDCEDEYEFPFARHWTASEADRDDD